MLIDLHIHECTYSSDSKATLEDIIAEARRKGLDAVTITDHDSNNAVGLAKEISERLNFPVFVGVEYLTLQGDIVAFGLDKVPQEKISAQEFIDLVNSQGGVCISAHPYRNNNRGLEDNLRTVKGLHGIEAFNGNTDDASNQKAYDTAKELGIQCIGSSDSHSANTIGKYATLLPYKVSSVEELIEAIKTNKCKPAIYKDGKYIIVD